MRGHIVPEFEKTPVRDSFVYRYRVIHQVSSAEVRILAGHSWRDGLSRMVAQVVKTPPNLSMQLTSNRAMAALAERGQNRYSPCSERVRS